MQMSRISRCESYRLPAYWRAILGQRFKINANASYATAVQSVIASTATCIDYRRASFSRNYNFFLLGCRACCRYLLALLVTHEHVRAHVVPCRAAKVNP